MNFKRIRPLVIGATIFLSGCSFISEKFAALLNLSEPPQPVVEQPVAKEQVATVEQKTTKPAAKAEAPAAKAAAPANPEQPAPPAQPVPRVENEFLAPAAVPANEIEVDEPKQVATEQGAPEQVAPEQAAPMQVAQDAPQEKEASAPATQSTGTFTGKKVREIRGELNRLKSSIGANDKTLQRIRAKMVQDSQRYFSTVGAINSRLQVGTTPGNPVLVQQFNKALGDLEQINADIGQLNQLTTSITANSTMAAFLAESASAAFRLSGAVEEDHVQLASLQDEIERTTVNIDRLLKDVSEDIRRQTNYVASERSNLNTLSASVKAGEILGASLANRAIGAALAPTAAPARATHSAAPASLKNQRPLVVIRFDRASVAYEQALYNAVSRTLERRPGATFELVAVTPASGGEARVALNSNKARRDAENVLRSLRGMGLPEDRVNISARTSETAQTNEVHLYIR
jgi:hypothetical protein